MVDFLLALLAWQRIFAILVTGKLLVELLLGELLPPLFFGAEAFGDGEEGHDRVVIEAIDFNLVENFKCVGQGFGHIAENGVHLSTSLEPLLLGVEQTSGVVEVLRCGQTEQVIVCLGVFLVDEVGVVCTYEFDAVFMG